MNLNDTLELRILLVTDIHSRIDFSSQLAKWLVERKESVDYIISSGDLVCMNPDDNLKETEVSAAEGDVASVLSSLENITSRLFYLPGNHDPHTLFGNRNASIVTEETKGDQNFLGLNPPTITTYSTNFHCKCLRLAPGLLLCGFGGSVPSYQNGKERWRGYPFTNDEEIKLGLETTWHHTTRQLEEDDKVLFVTHVGPFSSATTVEQVNLSVPIIESGSRVLDELLRREDLQKRVLANIHGHTHRAMGMGRVGKAYIINPGSLRVGKFALISLEKRPDHSSWLLSSIEFHRI